MAESSIHSAGFYPQFLWSLRKELSVRAGFDMLRVVRTLSCFHFRQLQPPLLAIYYPPTEVEQIIQIYRGILVRGLPTLAPIAVERALLQPFIDAQLVYEDIDDSGSIVFCPVSQAHPPANEWLNLVARSHVAIDPRLSSEEMDDSTFDSEQERRFFTDFLPTVIGKGVHQFCQLQTPFDVLLPDSEALEFVENRVDFSLVLPSVKNAPDQKIIYEVDGPEHWFSPQCDYDKIRDKALAAEGYSVERVPVESIDHPATIEGLRERLGHNRFGEWADKNVASPIWDEAMGPNALNMVLAGFSVARIQHVLLHALETSVLRMEQNGWRLAILERDVSCAEIAVVDFVIHLTQLIRLLDIDYQVPKIDLLIYSTAEMFDGAVVADCNALEIDEIRVERRLFEGDIDQAWDIDYFIDIAVLQRDGYNRVSPSMIAGHCPSVEIRSAYTFQDMRQVSPIAPIAYPMTENSVDCLRFFLNNVFRKKDFREKQFEILKRALALEPVIGLLPTGAGKSLCYQLAALLQPGMTVIIDPIISLMIDQADNLSDKFAIDWHETISSQKDTGEKIEVTQAMIRGKLKYIFLSPERLQIAEFRQALQRFCLRFPISYGVIDEAHCVSEWGHDFRTSYLRLAATLRENGECEGYEPIIIALTGTASPAVLSDIQREIGIDDTQAQIYPDKFDRPELRFRISQTPSKNKFNELTALLWKHLPSDLETPWNKLYVPQGPATHAGIVFTPYIRGDFGAERLSTQMSSELNQSVKYFAGSLRPQQKEDVLHSFKENEFSLLVATKAFGMGIDKSNIRYTVHYNIPASLEAFYQEAGRAGRDRKPAFCWLIFSEDGDVDRLMWFQQQAFKGVEYEQEKIRQIYQNHIGVDLAEIQPGSTDDIHVPFFTNGKDDQEQASRDKAIYRLALLGIVKDYTLDYNRKRFVVTAVRLSDSEIVENLQAYVGRYRTREYVEAIPQRLQLVNGSTMLGRCSALLLEFVYEEIELKRRAALRSMAEVARTASHIASIDKQDQYIRQELRAYLEESPFSIPLQAMADRIEPDQWLQILALTDIDDGSPLLSSVDGVRQLLGGCRRSLERSPEHPGLLFLSSICQLLLPEREVDQAVQDARDAFRVIVQLSQQNSADVIFRLLQEGYRRELVRTQDISRAFEAIATVALEEYPHRDLARHLFSYVPDMSERVIVNEMLSEIRQVNHRLLP